ncbi:MAG: undecaprenyl-phosphate glucose phosphotransferase [Parvibaculum sp.]|uniref:undecaprenyl-phosphate glucose phosphotransferase n=1 Tax=Parvibaculum sp. TaxID=2024848 RepID=UPI002AB890A4|nr:undecaprenyl-phosphate glucose phosphotransferase [Parvibaculum sp.]MDZ4379850.1 undecaprenyl-phosphate glucose phosphotransferase [Parvibaculum sp.]
MTNIGEKSGDGSACDGQPSAGGAPREPSGLSGQKAPRFPPDPAREQALVSKRVVSDTIMCVDGMAIFLAALVAKWAYIVAFLQHSPETGPYAVVGAVGAVIAVAAMRYQGLYDFDLLSETGGQTRRILIGLVAAALFLIAVGYLLKISEQYSRGWFVVWFAVSVVAVLAVHAVTTQVLQWLGGLGAFARNIVIYGSGDIAESVIRRVAMSPMNLRVVGVFDDLPRGQKTQVPLSGGLSDLISFGQQRRIDEVLIAMPMTNELQIANLVEQLSLLPADIRICPSATAFRIPPKKLLDYEGLAVLELERRPMDGWAPIVKNVEDKVLASLLLVSLTPLLLLIALAVKLDSRGPAIFKQRRHGFNHEVFNLYKFRTMYVAEDGPDITQATRKDPRVTRVGRFLRKTSLDELPQLFNVLRGDMSLVGPRPHALSHNEYYSTVLARYANRHKVKPGMTGWAQVNGYRGETDTPEKMRGRVERDLWYIENWSVWLDVKILAMTPFYGLIGKNAF